MGAGSGGQGGSNGFFKSQETSPEVSGQIGVTPEVSPEKGWEGKFTSPLSCRTFMLNESMSNVE